MSSSIDFSVSLSNVTEKSLWPVPPINRTVIGRVVVLMWSNLSENVWPFSSVYDRSSMLSISSLNLWYMAASTIMLCLSCLVKTTLVVFLYNLGIVFVFFVTPT